MKRAGDSALHAALAEQAVDDAILTLRIFLPHQSPWVREVAEKGLARIEKLMGKDWVEAANTRQTDRYGKSLKMYFPPWNQ